MFVFGSLENVPPIINEGRSLAEVGYIVHILALRYKSSQPKIEEVVEGFYIHRMTLLTRMVFGDNDIFQLLRYIEVAVRSFFAGIFQAADLFVAHDLITLPYVYPLARIRRRKVVYRAHELWSEQAPNYPKAYFWKKLDKFLSPRVDALVTAEENRAIVYSEEYHTPQFPTVVYNCPKFITRPHSSPLKEILVARNLKNGFIVYYQGGIASTRSIDKLVESMLYTSDDISLVLVGNTSESFIKWVSPFVKENKLEQRITLLGYIKYGDFLMQLCSGADIGVVFAKADCRNNIFSGTASNKLFEYMMLGLPILASDLKSYSEIVGNENIGICVISEDPKDIARGIMKLYDNKSKLKEMRENALRLSKEKYNWDVEFPKLHKLYEKLLG